jgi:uncharacterized protein
MLHIFNKEVVFFDLFDESATHVVSCAEQPQRLATGYPQSASEVQRIHAQEEKADEVAHRVTKSLNHTFIPPIDAQDVHALSGALDDTVDRIDAAAKRLGTYDIDAMEPIFVTQAGVLVQAAAAVSDAVHRLRHSRKLSDLGPTPVEIHRLEGVGDDYHHAAISFLFSGRCEPLYVLKWMEIHKLIEQAIDACEDEGNVLERIVLKGA